MPTAVHPMLATSIESPFDSPEWVFEIKWDGYRAVAFLEKGRMRLVSRNQNDLTAQYSELHDLPKFVNANTAVLDGEIIALDEKWPLLFQPHAAAHRLPRPQAPHGPAKPDICVLYYAFDLIYLDGYDLHRVALEDRKQAARLAADRAQRR